MKKGIKFRECRGKKIRIRIDYSDLIETGDKSRKERRKISLRKVREGNIEN